MSRWVNRLLPRASAPRIAGRYTEPYEALLLTTGTTSIPQTEGSIAHSTQGPTSVMGRFPSSSIFNGSLSRHSIVALAWCRGSFGRAVRHRVRRGGGCSRRTGACSTSCVLRRVLASVRGQRIGCQLHAQSKSVPECLSPQRARTRHIGSANEWAHVHHRGPRPGEGTLVGRPPSGAARSSSPR